MKKENSTNSAIATLIFLIAFFGLLIKVKPSTKNSALSEAKTELKQSKLKKRIAVLIFLFGILIQISAFFVDKSDNAPFLLNVLAPSYVNASRGVAILAETGSLLNGNDGFKDLTNIVKPVIKAEKIPCMNNQIFGFQDAKQAGFYAGSNGSEFIRPIKIYCNKDQYIESDIKGLKELVEQYKKETLFRWGLSFLVIGVVISILGVFIKI